MCDDVCQVYAAIIVISGYVPFTMAYSDCVKEGLKIVRRQRVDLACPAQSDQRNIVFSLAMTRNKRRDFTYDKFYKAVQTHTGVFAEMLRYISDGRRCFYASSGSLETCWIFETSFDKRPAVFTHFIFHLIR